MERPIHFLELATELRLKIYTHLIVDCLAGGCSKGLASLFLSCRTVHKELAADVIAKARPLLIAQAQWRRTCDENPVVSYEPLCLQSSVQSLFSHAAARKLVITLPMPANWIAWISPNLCGNRRVTLWRIPSFVQLLSSLRPLLRLQWAELTIKLCKKTTADAWEFQDIHEDVVVYAGDLYMSGAVQTTREVGMKLDIDFAASVSRTFFRALADLDNDGVRNLTRTDRLILNYGNAVNIPNIHHLGGYLTMFFTDFTLSWTDAPVMPKPKRAWTARVLEGKDGQRGWKLVYDYRDGLVEVEGALWEIYLNEGWWKVKRLFTEIDGKTFEDFEEQIDDKDGRLEYNLATRQV
jgi:hypothetical protein